MSLKNKSKKLKSLLDEQSILTHKIKVKYSQKTNINDFDKLWAYVVFENPKGKTKVIQKFSRSNQLKLWKYDKENKKYRCWVKSSRNYKLKDQYRLHIRTAPDPTEIIWENLETSNKEVWWRRFIIILIIFTLLIVGWFLIYFARIYESSLDNVKSWQAAYDKPIDQLHSDSEINWFCSRKTFSMLMTDAGFRDVCGKYLYIVAYKQLIMLLISGAIFGINEGIEFILTILK